MNDAEFANLSTAERLKLDPSGVLHERLKSEMHANIEYVLLLNSLDLPRYWRFPGSRIPILSQSHRFWPRICTSESKICQ